MDRIYKRWYDYGFLDGLSYYRGYKLAHAFEYVEDILTKRFADDYIATVVFPVLRRVYTTGSRLRMTEEFIDDMLYKLKQYLKTDMHKNYLKIGASGSTIDGEAESLENFVKIYYGGM